MRILSSHTDYYDCVQGLGQDRTLLFHRERRFMDWKAKPKLKVFDFSHRNHAGHVYVLQTLIGFCGKLHVAVKIDDSKPIYDSDWGVCCYDLDDVDQFVKRAFKPRVVEDYLSKSRRKPWCFSRQRVATKCFEVEQTPALKELLTTHPIFKIELELLTVNPSLNDLEFYRIAKPYDAFQQLAAWMGNQAQPRKEIPNISDEIMVEVKGFDRWSFRKPPSGR